EESPPPVIQGQSLDPPREGKQKGKIAKFMICPTSATNSNHIQCLIKQLAKYEYVEEKGKLTEKKKENCKRIDLESSPS
ncbi:hypothetical protein H920_03042, partial [Fukomys damarensis]